MRLQTAGAHRAMRWANGAGTTHEIVAHPAPEDWAWRLSLAEVSSDGPFSVLPRVDRALVVASGAGMDLEVGESGGERRRLRSYDVTTFRGDVPSSATLLDGPVRDLNLMVRRGRGIGAPVLRVEHLAAGDEVAIADAVAVVVLDGVLSVVTAVDTFPFNPRRERASRFDALLATGDEDDVVVRVVRDAVVAVASFAPLVAG